jgi:hypothetical protein
VRFVTQLFAPSLLRALVGRTVAVAVGALVVLAAVALYESNELLTQQFDDEAGIVATAAYNDIIDQTTILQRQASLLAGLPNIRELTEDRDRGALEAFLLPQKSRLLVGMLNVADTSGRLIAGAQDFVPGETLKPDLVALAEAGAQQSWSMYDEPQGIVIRAIYMIRGREQEPIGYVEVGGILGDDYLKSINTKSDAQLALVWNAQVRASTTPIPAGAVFPTVDEVELAPGDTVTRRVTFGEKSYYGIFRSCARRPRSPACSRCCCRSTRSRPRSATSCSSSSSSPAGSSPSSRSSPTGPRPR